MPGKYETASRCAYWGYKIFQAARLCMGDYSSLVELLVEGCAEFAAEEALCVAYDAYELARNTRDVGKFIGNLTSELQAYGSATQAAASMEKAHMAYVMFVQCDTDDDGKISKTEFIRFASLMGETEGHAVKLFGALDTDNNGEQKPRCW